MLCTVQPTDAEDFVLVNPSQGLDELAANDAVSAFLLETQTAAGKWKRGVASASAGALVPGVVPGPVEDVVAWRAGLKVIVFAGVSPACFGTHRMLQRPVFQAGDYLDAQDHQLHWFDSRVVEVQPAFSTADTLPVEFRRKAEEALRIHFMGWDSKYDMWFLRSSPKLQPLFTKVRNWRDFRVNDKIEMRVSGRWYVVRVEEVDRVGNRILVRPMDKTQKTALGDRWFDFMRYVQLHREKLLLHPRACLLT